MAHFQCRLLVLVNMFTGYYAPPGSCVTDDIARMWPLGKYVETYELITGIFAGQAINTTYIDGTTDMSYMTCEFTVGSNAFVEFPFPWLPVIENDHSIKFHIFPKADGIFFHFEHDPSYQTTGEINDMKFAIENGNFTLILTDKNGIDYARSLDGVFTYNTWNSFILERDMNRVTFDLVINGNTWRTGDYDAWVSNAALATPGTLRIGGSRNGDNFFSGGVACLQFISCTGIDTLTEFNQACGQNWPPTTTTTTVTTTTSILSTITTQLSSSTSDSTTSVPSPITTELPTTSTSSQSASTSTTSQIQTSSTESAALTTSATPSPPSSTELATTTTQSTIVFQPIVIKIGTVITWKSSSTSTAILTPAMSAESIKTGGHCRHYQKLCFGYTYAHATNTIVAITARSVQQCMWLCNKNVRCESFVYKPNVCTLGTFSPQLQHDGVSVMYEMLP